MRGMAVRTATRDGAVCALHKDVSWEWQGAWRLMSSLHSVCYSVSPKAVCIPKGRPFCLSAERECLFLTLTMVLYRLIMAVKTPRDLRDPRKR